VHPGIDDAEQRVIGSLGPEVRQTDYDFLISADAREMIDREGITLLSYQPVQQVWRDRQDSILDDSEERCRSRVAHRKGHAYNKRPAL